MLATTVLMFGDVLTALTDRASAGISALGNKADESQHNAKAEVCPFFLPLSVLSTDSALQAHKETAKN